MITVIRQSTAQRYVHEASRYLIGSRQRRSRFIRLINESISSCDDNESEIDYSELVQTLGAPKMFVENLICGTPGITLVALRRHGRDAARDGLRCFSPWLRQL